jgi:hypothetical protein
MFQANLAHGVVSIHARHSDVGNNQIWMLLFAAFNQLGSIRSDGNHLVAHQWEHAAKVFPHHRLIVSNSNPQRFNHGLVLGKVTINSAPGAA